MPKRRINKLFVLPIQACVCCPDNRKDKNGWPHCLQMGEDPDGTPIYYIDKHWNPPSMFAEDFPGWCPLKDTPLPSRKECAGWEPEIEFGPLDIRRRHGREHERSENDEGKTSLYSPQIWVCYKIFLPTMRRRYGEVWICPGYGPGI